MRWRFLLSFLAGLPTLLMPSGAWSSVRCADGRPCHMPMAGHETHGRSCCRTKAVCVATVQAVGSRCVVQVAPAVDYVVSRQTADHFSADVPVILPPRVGLIDGSAARRFVVAREVQVVPPRWIEQVRQGVGPRPPPSLVV